MRVLVTRPAGDAERTAAALERAGHAATISPALAIRFIESPVIGRADWRAIVVTSRHAAAALARHDDAEIFKAKPLLAVGEATETAARAAGFRTVRSAGGDVAALLAEIDGGDWPGPLLYASGEAVAVDLVAALARRGISAARAVVYAADTVPVLDPSARAALEAGTLDGVVFFSPRTVSGFAGQLRQSGLDRAADGLTAWCLSKAIGDAAKSAGFTHIVIAEHKSEESLIAAIAAPQ